MDGIDDLPGVRELDTLADTISKQKRRKNAINTHNH